MDPSGKRNRSITLFETWVATRTSFPMWSATLLSRVLYRDRLTGDSVARAIGKIFSADFQSASMAMRVGYDAHLEVGATKMDTAY